MFKFTANRKARLPSRVARHVLEGGSSVKGKPYKILGRIFDGLTTNEQIEEGILQTHQCTPATYRWYLGLEPDAPLSEVDRVLAARLGEVSDAELPEAYLALLRQLVVDRG